MARHDPIFVEAGCSAVRRISGLPLDVSPGNVEAVLHVYGEDLTAAPLFDAACAKVSGDVHSLDVTFDGPTFLALGAAGYSTRLEVRDVTSKVPLPDGVWHGVVYVEGVGNPDVEPA